MSNMRYEDSMKGVADQIIKTAMTTIGILIFFFISVSIPLNLKLLGFQLFLNAHLLALRTRSIPRSKSSVNSDLSLPYVIIIRFKLL